MHLEEVQASCAGPETASGSGPVTACAKGHPPKPRLSAEQVRLRLLRCTAEAMVSSPGGLRFVSGARPWLEGLAGGKPQRKGHPPCPAPTFSPA
jgi:hypothetical protein